MNITQILKENKSGVAFEFFPPRNPKSQQALRDTLGELRGYSPLYVSMTCGAAGTSHEITQQAVALLKEYKGLAVMPHLTCVSVDSQALKSTLDCYQSMDINAIMALRGDIPQGLDRCGGLAYAKQLIDLIKDYGHFSIAAAVYPEGHIESLSLEDDLIYTKEKIEAGVDFAVTQMFFDNNYYYDFLQRIRSLGVDIPIIPGILPLTNIAKVKEFAAICKATIPAHIEHEINRFSGSAADMEKAGIELTIRQCRDLTEHGFKQLHFFTLNRASIMKNIIDSVF